jgi:hypothetical protein
MQYIIVDSSFQQAVSAARFFCILPSNERKLNPEKMEA